MLELGMAYLQLSSLTRLRYLSHPLEESIYAKIYKDSSEPLLIIIDVDKAQTKIFAGYVSFVVYQRQLCTMA